MQKTASSGNSGSQAILMRTSRLHVLPYKYAMDAGLHANPAY